MTHHTDTNAQIAEVTQWRRHLHANPEFGFEETNTAAFVVKKLRAFGIEEITEGVGTTGVVATLRCGSGNRAIALRADMDALRIEETGDLAHKSTCPGVMHACGHDGHTAMLLGAARQLAHEGGFDGLVRLIFQPAEEWGKGMQAMLDDGLLRRFPFEEAFAIHNMPGIAVGHFATRAGAFMAAEDNFEITMRGMGGHASRPQDGKDALVAACATVMALQTIVSRAIDPTELAVLSVTELITDGTRNAIAGNARILGDCRSFDAAVSKNIEAAMRRVAQGTALAHNCQIETDYTREFIPLINDTALSQAAIQTAHRVAEQQSAVNDQTPRIGASEDFARLLEHVPGNFMLIGNGDSASLHNPAFDFNDDALVHGLNYLTQIVRTRLPVN